MPKLLFTNPGNLDPRLITTFGASVKLGSDPFGRFGSGLKYGIAGVLRLGGSIEIFSGEAHWSFHTQTEVIRDKEFNLVYFRSHHPEDPQHLQPCGFTTDLGSHWEPWMLYREFYCNAMDEGGGVSLIPDHSQVSVHPDTTSVLISCPALTAVYQSRFEFFIPPTAKPLWGNSRLQIFPGQSPYVFFKGVRIFTLPKKALFTYNFISDPGLTEDRTLGSSYTLTHTLANLLREGNAAEDWSRRTMLAPEETFEQTLDVSQGWTPPSEKFLEQARELVSSSILKVNRSVQDIYYSKRQGEALPSSREPNSEEAPQIAAAKAYCALVGVPISSPILIAESLGAQVYGVAKDGRIYLSSLPFIEGPQKLVGTLIEEQAHITFDLPDGRPLQNLFLELLCKLAFQVFEERKARAEALDDEIPF